MILKFFGGAQEVGRSAILVRDDRSIMLDFGMKIERKNEYPIAIPNIDALILSHAHLDHVGYAPAIYNEAHIPAFGTKPTQELATLLLDDAINIAKKERLSPKYHKREVNTLNNRYVPMNYHQPFHFGNYDIEFADAGHICGAAITLIERPKGKENKRIVYTGDFKLSPQSLHSGAEVVKSDVLITESTYANKNHTDRQELVTNFVKEVNEVLENGGTALIPVFAIGRSQEILTILYKHGLGENIYVDGMCRAATKIVAKNKNFINDPDALSDAIRSATWIDDTGERGTALNEPSIILTTAGMLNGGPVLNYITKLNSNSRIFITGYQVRGTNGNTLVENGFIKLDDKKVKINNPVSVYDFSAHADKKDLYDYVRASSPNVVVCVHGEKENTKDFAEQLKGEGFEAYAPRVGETIQLKD